jgi:hypothetical protein
MPEQEIDEASYQEGRAAFSCGASLRDILEQIFKADTQPDDVKVMSGALGFVDAAFDKLRGITR